MIFAETGLVVFPLLPGDSLLFLAGTVAAASGIDVHLLALVLFGAAVAGDSVNYAVGRFLGPRVFDLPPAAGSRAGSSRSTWSAPSRFYEKYGGFTIIIVPLRADRPHVRAVPCRRRRDDLPPVPGLQRDRRPAWVASLVYAGYLFGNIPWVKANLTFIVLAIVAISLLPIAVHWLSERRRSGE